MTLMVIIRYYNHQIFFRDFADELRRFRVVTRHAENASTFSSHLCNLKLLTHVAADIEEQRNNLPSVVPIWSLLSQLPAEFCVTASKVSRFDPSSKWA